MMESARVCQNVVAVVMLDNRLGKCWLKRLDQRWRYSLDLCCFHRRVGWCIVGVLRFGYWYFRRIHRA